MTFDALLSGAAVVAAVTAMATYAWLLVRRFQLIRLLTGLGLFLTGLALFQAPHILALAADLQLRLAVAALILAVVAQIVSSLRTRLEWNGAERRATEASAR